MAPMAFLHPHISEGTHYPTVFCFSFLTHSLTLCHPALTYDTSQNLHLTDFIVKKTKVVLNLSTITGKEKWVVNQAVLVSTLILKTGIIQEEAL